MLTDLSLYLLEFSSMRARVRASITLAGEPSGLTLHGSLRGPLCATASTLTTTVPFRSLVPTSSTSPLIAEALVTDPCAWSPEHPHLYHVQLELKRGPQAIARLDRTLGMRAVSIRKNSLFFDGKRRVLRGQHETRIENNGSQAWRESGLARLVDALDDDEGHALSQNGILVLARLGPANWKTNLRQLACFAAVAVVVVRHENFQPEMKSLAPNVLWAQEFGTNEPVKPASWAQLAVVQLTPNDIAQSPENTRAAFAQRIAECSLPIIPWLPRGGTCVTLDAARAGCDSLQSHLAPLGQFAGYIV